MKINFERQLGMYVLVSISLQELEKDGISRPIETSKLKSAAVWNSKLVTNFPLSVVMVLMSKKAIRTLIK